MARKRKLRAWIVFERGGVQRRTEATTKTEAARLLGCSTRDLFDEEEFLWTVNRSGD